MTIVQWTVLVAFMVSALGMVGWLARRHRLDAERLRAGALPVADAPVPELATDA